MHSARNYLLLGLAALAVTAGAIGWVRQHQALAEWQARATDDEEALVRQAADQAALTAKLKEARSQIALLQETLKHTSAKVAAAKASHRVPPPPARIPLTAAQMQQWLADANDPAELKRLLLQARQLTLNHYGAFFAQMHLSPEQTEALTKLLTDKRLAISDVAVASAQNGIDPLADPAAFDAQVAAARASIDGQVADLLGQDGLADFRTYDQNFAANASVTQVERVLGNTPDALSAAQSTQLLQLLEATGSGRISPQAIAQAQTFLSPAQVQALQVAVQRQRANQAQQRAAQMPAAPAGN